MAGKHKVSNSAQQGGDTQIKPLLPLEYCSIERAARLLGCEEYDLFHFERIGAIEMCVGLDRHRGSISFISENVRDNKSLPGEYKFGEQSSLYNTNGCAYLSGFWTVSVKDIRGEVLEVDVFGKNGDFTIYEEHGGSVIGENISANINEAIKVDDFEGHVMTNIHLDVMPYVNRSIDERIVCDAAAGVTIAYSGVVSVERFCASRLVIMRPDLERLYGAMFKGEILQNRYNNEAIRIAAEKREAAQELSLRARTPADSLLAAFGVLALIAADDKPNLKRGTDNVNQGSMVDKIKEKAAEIGIDPNDVQWSNLDRDIGNGVKQAKELIPTNRK
ncbi:MAG: hypothetical protein ACK5M8_03530 [Shewanella algae]